MALRLGMTDRHSILVAWAKIVLPLLALAVLSTLFMVSRPISPDQAIPYADVDVEDRLRDPRLTAPSFAGMTEDGAAVTLQADEATPGLPGAKGAGQARGLSGRIATPDGVETKVTAGLARLDPGGQTVTLSDQVSLTNSTGYGVQTAGLTLQLDRTRLESQGAVTAQAPFGTLTAGKMLLTRAADGRYRLDFTGGVRLLYQPGTPG